MLSVRTNITRQEKAEAISIQKRSYYSEFVAFAKLTKNKIALFVSFSPLSLYSSISSIRRSSCSCSFLSLLREPFPCSPSRAGVAPYSLEPSRQPQPGATVFHSIFITSTSLLKKKDRFRLSAPQEALSVHSSAQVLPFISRYPVSMRRPGRERGGNIKQGLAWNANSRL